MSTHNMAGAVLDFGDIAINKTDQTLYLQGAHNFIEEKNMWWINTIRSIIKVKIGEQNNCLKVWANASKKWYSICYVLVDE